MKQLTVKGYRLDVTANRSPRIKGRLPNWGLLKYFEIVLASAEEGISKLDIEIFHRALTVAKYLPDNAVMVGDRYRTRLKSWYENGMDKTRSWRIGKCCS